MSPSAAGADHEANGRRRNNLVNHSISTFSNMFPVEQRSRRIPKIDVEQMLSVQDKFMYQKLFIESMKRNNLKVEITACSTLSVLSSVSNFALKDLLMGTSCCEFVEQYHQHSLQRPRRSSPS